jgi:hypothetical protein
VDKHARAIRTTVRTLIAAITLSLGLAACNKSDVAPNTGTAAASAQLNWDQANWNQANWQ